MFIVFCDGSTKIKNCCVVTSLVVVQCSSEGRIVEVIYCAKRTYTMYYQDSLHELLAIVDGLNAIKLLNISAEKIGIISDSMEWIENLNSFKVSGQWSGKGKDLMEKLDKLWLDKIFLEWASRTTLGINVADFLNKEPIAWTNNLDKKYLTSQMKKLVHKDYLYNISSKK